MKGQVIVCSYDRTRLRLGFSLRSNRRVFHVTFLRKVNHNCMSSTGVNFVIVNYAKGTPT